MYRLAPMTNRRILGGGISLLAFAGAYFVFYDHIWMAIVMGACGLALVPINLAVRDFAVKRMIAEYDSI